MNFQKVIINEVINPDNNYEYSQILSNVIAFYDSRKDVKNSSIK